MTRKQAVSQAIAILEKEDKNQEICQKLQEIMLELPMTHWSDKTIFDAFDQYILEHNCLPSMSEISRNPKIPTHPTIKNRFGLTLQEFYKKYYNQYIRKSPSRVYHYHNTSYWIENFREQYTKNNYPSQKEYDSLRDKNTPCAKHIIKISGYKNWNELLYNCGFKIQGQNFKSTITMKNNKQTYTINSINNTLDEQQIKKVKQHLQSIITRNN